MKTGQLVEKAWEHKKAGRLQEAANIYQEIVETWKKERPEQTDMLTSYMTSLAELLAEMGEVEQALAVMGEAGELLANQASGSASQAWVSYLYSQVSLFKQLERFDDAARSCRELVEYTYSGPYRDYSDYFEAHLHLAQILFFDLQDLDSAREEFEKLVIHFDSVLQKGPLAYNAGNTYLEALMGLMQTSKDTGRLDDALKNIQKAERFVAENFTGDSPEMIGIHFNRGLILKELGQPDDGQKALQNALELSRRLTGEDSPPTRQIKATLEGA